MKENEYEPKRDEGAAGSNLPQRDERRNYYCNVDKYKTKYNNKYKYKSEATTNTKANTTVATNTNANLERSE